jgi:adenylate cyclase
MKWSKLVTVSAIFFTAFLLSFSLRYGIPAFEDLELKTLDWRFEWKGVESVEDSPIVLVTIDNDSFEALPERWPYPRSYYAHVVENLTRAGAIVIGIDVIFDVPDKYDPQKDVHLAEAIRASGKVILARKLEQSPRLRTYRFLVEPIDTLKDAARNSMGLVSIESDVDGIYRRYPVYQMYRDEYLFSFVVEVIKKFAGDHLSVQFDRGKNYVQAGEFRIPLYESSTMLINFAGPAGTFPQYSFASVIDDERIDLGENYDLNFFTESLQPDSVFKDKIVLIGSTVAELHDNFPTPFLEYHGTLTEMPGVEILANAVHTVLNNVQYRKPSFWIILVIMLILIALIQYLIFRLSTVWSAVLTVIILLIVVASQFVLFTRYHLVMEMVFPVLGISFAFVSITLYRFVLTQQEKRKIMGAFQQYVPPKVIKELLEHPEKLTLGGEERHMTVLFTDVANFTTISETLSPQDLVLLINEYLSKMTEIIMKYDGIIDKYEGDAIMAEFGAPVHYQDHALKACYTALEMQKHLKELSRQWRMEGKPVLSCRAGINTGNMVVGNMGSKKVFDYTVLGDEVNLASRLEGANKIFGTRVMISDSTYQEVKEACAARPLDMIMVKGRQKPVRVHELIARKDEPMDDILRKMLQLFHDGIHHYHIRNWELAAENFRHCLKLVPGDGPSRLYLRRVIQYAKAPPPKDWDGVFEIHIK